jgi:hypothetical protein
MKSDTTIFDVYVAKSTLVSGTSLSETRTPLVSSYGVQSDIDETTDVNIETGVYRSTADGEVPQLQCTLASRGGGELGETTIDPGVSVRVDSVVSGADAIVGMTGV